MNVIITGAGKGIGKATALKFASENHNLFLCARNESDLLQTSAEIKKLYPSVTVQYKPTDLTDKVQLTAFAEWCLQFGLPDILINNAGTYVPGNCLDENDQLDIMMQTNFYSAYHLTRKIVPHMIAKRSGHIFNISSIAALDAYDGGGCYSISKFALHGFNKNLRHELKPHSIKVTAVVPGAVFTDSWKRFDNSNGRIMEANDIAEMIFACSKLSPQAVVEEIIMRPQLGDL